VIRASRFPSLPLFLLVIAAAAASGQQERKISMKALPSAVREAFEKQFPQARVSGVTEEKEAGGVVYEIESRWKGRQYDVTFRPDGSLVSVEETIPMAEVPPAVAAGLKREFPDAKVTKAEKITESGVIAYEFQLRGGPKKEAKFSPDGKLLEAE